MDSLDSAAKSAPWTHFSISFYNKLWGRNHWMPYPISCNLYMLVIKQLAMQELIGGVVYDALRAQVAIKAKAQKILTLNVKDFKRVYPESDIISLP